MRHLPRIKMGRDWYIPKNAQLVPTTVPGLTLYAYDQAGRFYGLGFWGDKSVKPYFNYSYGTAERRQAQFGQAIAHRVAHNERMAARAKARKDFVHDYKVGDLFKTSWGYDQTNVDFYEVTAVRGKVLELREVAQERTDTGYLCGRTKPKAGSFVNDKVYRVRASEGGVTVDGHSAWRVKPGEDSYWSAYA